MLATITSTEGTLANIQKVGLTLFLLGFLEVVNDSEWGSPYFTQTKPKSN